LKTYCSSLPALPSSVPKPMRARAVVLHRKMRAGEAFRLVLLECLAQAAANARAVSEARDAEGLHQLRVALRRLRVALDIYADASGDPALAALKARARRFSRDIAPARDLDVLVGDMLAPMARQVGVRAVAELQTRAEPLRQRAWDAAAETAGGAAFTAFLEDIAALALAEPRRHGGMKVKKLARRTMEKCWSKAIRRARRFRQLEPHQRHRLRIALKRLRYSAESFASLYREKDVAPYIAHLKILQNGLGDLNDAAGLMALGERFDGPAAARIAVFQHARAARLHRQMHRVWKDFKKLKPFWD
jgi:CHAD domain-containing protein